MFNWMKGLGCHHQWRISRVIDVTIIQTFFGARKYIEIEYKCKHCTKTKRIPDFSAKEYIKRRQPNDRRQM